jgi:DNA-binding transcriptional ArsR family regulator
MPKQPRCCRGRGLPPTLALAAELNGVLSDGNRLRILCLLKAGELCVCEIWQHLTLPQNLVSHHLRAMRQVGLLKSRKDGLKVFYALDKAFFRRHLATLSGFTK